MKRLLTAAATALTLMGGMSATAAYAQPSDYGHHDDRDRHDDHSQQWDDHQHNGYSYHGRWHYGPPPANLQGRVDYGFHQWRRGDRLPSYYRTRYQEVDWHHEHYRAPPRGYHYVRDDRGEVLLVGIATGAILSAILSH